MQEKLNVPTLARMLVGTGLVGIALVLSTVLRLLNTVITTRLSEVAEFGVYATINAATAVLAVAALGGWPSFVLATVPKHGLTRPLIASMQRSLAWSCLLFVTLQSVFIILALRNHIGASTVALAASLLVGIVFATSLNEAQRAAGNIIRSRFSIAVIPPTVAVTIIVGTALSGLIVSAGVIVFANSAGWFLLWIWAGHSLRGQYVDRGTTGSSISRWDLYIFKLCQALLSMGDVFVVGALTGANAGALYAIASRLATSVGMVNTAITMAFGPRLSRVAGDREIMRNTVRKMTAIGGVATLMLAGLLILVRIPVLRVFGEEYIEASRLVVILTVGVIAIAVCGPIGTVVTVIGQEQMARKTLVIASAVFLTCLPLATLKFGALGAATVWALVSAGWNLALWLQVDLGHTSIVHDR